MSSSAPAWYPNECPSPVHSLDVILKALPIPPVARITAPAWIMGSPGRTRRRRRRFSVLEEAGTLLIVIEALMHAVVLEPGSSPGRCGHRVGEMTADLEDLPLSGPVENRGTRALLAWISAPPVVEILPSAHRVREVEPVALVYRAAMLPLRRCGPWQRLPSPPTRRTLRPRWRPAGRRHRSR